MERQKRPKRPHGSEKKTDQWGKIDEGAIGRKGGADLDIEKREKDLESPEE